MDMAKGDASKPATKADIGLVRAEIRDVKSSVDARFDRELPPLRTDIKRLDGRIVDIDERLGKVDERLGKVEGSVRALTGVVGQTLGRMDRLETSLRDEINKGADRIAAILDSFGGDALMFKQKALTHGAMLFNHEESLQIHGAMLKGHAARLKSLESKR